MKKLNIIIIIIIAVVLGLLAGYSVFRIDSDIETKTTPSKNIDVDFVKIGKIEEVGSIGTKAYITVDRDYITIEVPKLEYVGAYVKVPITIKNVGLIPAKLKWINEYGINTNKAINVTYSGIGITDKVLHPGETTNIIITIKWDRDLKYTNEFETYFRISLYYEQG